MKIIPLGTNGYFPSFGRQTACYAIPYKKKLIILDGGSGLFRLGEPEGRKLIEGVQEVFLFLSHYHLDHTFGFYAAFQLLENKKVYVFGSKQKKVFSELAKLNYFPVDFEKKHSNFEWKTSKIGENKIDDFSVKVRKQYHRGEGSLAFRFDFPSFASASAGEGFAYVTDSEPTKEGIEFVRDVPLLLHEHGVIGDKRQPFEEQIENGHVTSVGAAMIAKEARVGKLVLIHHNPFLDNNALKKQTFTAKTIFPSTKVAVDIEAIDF